MKRILAVVLLLACSVGRAEPIPTESGLIDGIVLSSGVRAWLGVPMAAPPVRELRWKPPAPCRNGPVRFMPIAGADVPPVAALANDESLLPVTRRPARTAYCLNIWAPLPASACP